MENKKSTNLINFASIQLNLENIQSKNSSDGNLEISKITFFLLPLNKKVSNFEER